MIIEGFEIENWSCIKKLTLAGLPATGVIVLHGPNRTGKSSLVQALRACLMDYPSTTAALKSSYPRGSGEKPTVSVTFNAGGTTYRIRKCFGSNKSELASRTSAGAWRVETTTAAEAHSQVCDRVGGGDSTKGLRQASLAHPGRFPVARSQKVRCWRPGSASWHPGRPANSTGRPVHRRVKKHWNVWHSGQRKAGKEQSVKTGCKLAENLKTLDEARGELNESEEKFKEVEGMLRQTVQLESQRVDLSGQLAGQRTALEKYEREREQSQTCVAARRLAVEKHSHAVKEQREALEEQRQRVEAVKRMEDADQAVGPRKEKAEILKQAVESIVQKLAKQKAAIAEQRNRRRDLQQRVNRVAENLVRWKFQISSSSPKAISKARVASRRQLPILRNTLRSIPCLTRGNSKCSRTTAGRPCSCKQTAMRHR